MTNNLSIEFLGGAGTVTGSKILVESNNHRILVDCGLFQGIKQLRLLNRAGFPVEPSTIEAIVLTHAHLDHCGYIPVLVKNGFKGAIHCTFPTRDLTEVILRDSGKIQEEDAERANRHRYSRHHPAKPLYTEKDAINAMEQFVPHNYHEWVILNEDMKFQLLNSGHILGSGLIQMKCLDKQLLFSGDLGRSHPILLEPPEKIKETDFLVVESTYGDRLHPKDPAKKKLKEIIAETYNKSGTLIIPTFAVERAQEIIYLLSLLKSEDSVPNIPIYLDSPMGADATEIMMQYPKWHKLSEDACKGMSSTIKIVRDVETSKAVVKDKTQKIVLAGSGMVEGGRVLHYLNNYLGDETNTILLVGFQAEGTRGRALKEGVHELKFFGEYHPVKAKIREITSFSAHADQSEILSWLRNFDRKPETVFINHGEPQAADALRVKIEHELGWNCEVAAISRKCPLN